MRILSFIIVIAILILCIMFTSLNASSATVNYLLGQKEIPLIAIMFISLILGILLCFILMIWKVIKLKSKVCSLERKLNKSEKHNKTDSTLKEI